MKVSVARGGQQVVRLPEPCPGIRSVLVRRRWNTEIEGDVGLHTRAVPICVASESS